MRVLLLGCTESMTASMPEDAPLARIEATDTNLGRGGVLVIGPLVDEPLRVAQRLCRGTGMELVLAPERQGVAPTTKQLAITPFIPIESQVVSADDVAALRHAVEGGLERARRNHRLARVVRLSQQSLKRIQAEELVATSSRPDVVEEHLAAVESFLAAYEALEPELSLQGEARGAQEIVGPASVARAAVSDGAWPSYAQRLKAVAGDAHRRGIALSDRQAALSTFRRALIPHLLEARAEPDHAERRLVGMDAFCSAVSEEMASSWREAERTQLERAWTRERLFGSVVESTRDAILSATTEGIVTAWNPGAEQLYGYTEDEAVGSRLDRLFDAETDGALFAEVVREQTARSVELARRTRDGRSLRVAVTLAPIESRADGSLVGVSEISRDITEIARHRAWRAATVTGALDGIVTMDHTGAIVELNEAAERLFGHTLEDVKGTSLADAIIPTRLRGAHRRGLARYLETGAGVLLNQRADVTACRRDGTEFPAEVSIVRLEGIEPPLFAGFVRDQTELRAAQEELRATISSLQRSNEDLERFAYLASHDLQEPLRMVSAYLQLLENRSGEQLDELALEFLGHARGGAARMRALIDGLLALARVDARGSAFEWVDMNAVVDTALASSAVCSEERLATISVERLPTVWGDSAQLTSVVENLVGNALTHGGDEPPVIEIGVELDGAWWRFFVRDHGVGFEPGQRERIFEVFQSLRRHDSRAEGRQSTGIGLAIAKRIVQRHGGTISAEGRPGAGATFHFALPATPAPDPHRGSRNASNEESPSDTTEGDS